jgi:O-antigen/teichoic acid export membrane protein
MLSALFMMLYLEVGIVVLSAVRSSEEVGLYTVGHRLLMITVMVPTAIAFAILPTLLGYGRDFDRLEALLRRLSRMVVMVGLPLSVGLFLLAGRLMPYVFGPDYVRSGVSTSILAWVIVLRFESLILSEMFVAYHLERLRTKLQLGAVGLALALCFLLIPRLGYLGAAWAALGTETLLLAAYLVVVRRLGHRPLAGGWLPRAGGAAVLMAVVCLFVRDTVHPLLAVLVGAMVYALGLAVLRAYRPEDREILRAFVPAGRRPHVDETGPDGGPIGG